MENKIAEIKEKAKTIEIKSIGDFLTGYKPQLLKVLQNNETKFCKFEQIILMAAKKIPNASLNSVMACSLKSIQYNLEPNIHCHFVPFGKDAQFIIDYRGYIELINRSGKATILHGDAVKSNDEFKYSNGLNPVLDHTPAIMNRGEFVGAYVVAKNLIANEKVFLFLNKEEIEKVKRSSKSTSSTLSPWHNWHEQMALKTVVKRIAKLLPLSVETQSALGTDETITHEINKDMGQTIDITDYETAINEKEPEAKPQNFVEKMSESI